MGNDSDSAWKEVIEKLAREFLEYFMPDIANDLDPAGGIVFLNDELQEIAPPGEEKNRYVDKLLRVRLKDKNVHWILVHIEVQGYEEDEFPKRMFRYFYRLMDKYGKEITALAIFTDANKSFKPRRYDYSFYQTTLRYEYRTFKVLDVSEEVELARIRQNPFSHVVLTVLKLIREGKNRTKYLSIKTELVRRLALSGLEPYVVTAIFRFIDVMVWLPPEMNRKLYKTIRNDKEIKKMHQEHVMGGLEKIIFDEGKQEGKQEGKLEGKREGKLEGKLEGKREGKQEGKLEGKLEVAKKMLAKKMPEKLVAELSGLKKKDIDRLKKLPAG